MSCRAEPRARCRLTHACVPVREAPRPRRPRSARVNSTSLPHFVHQHSTSNHSPSHTIINVPTFEGIRACVVSKTRVLEEFDDPDYPSDLFYSHTRYIQAGDDQSFRVQITLLAGFDFCGADVVRCRLFLDYDNAPFWSTFTHPPPDGIVREDRAQHISTATRQNQVGDWEKMPFVFGSLKVSK
jgi:hypothetical protein